MMDINFSTGAEMSNLVAIPFRHCASRISYSVAPAISSTNGWGYTWHALARPPTKC